MKNNNLDDKLFDAMLKVGAEEALKQEMEEMPSCEEMNAQYKPSPDLEKKIRRQISKYMLKEKTFLWKRTAMKVAASAAVFVVFSSVVLLSVEATRNYIFNSVIKWQEDYFSIQHDENKENSADINIYKPTYLPENFIEISSNSIGDIIKITYENENGLKIFFQYSPSQSSHLLADNEDKTYLVTKINGQEAYLFKATQDDKNNIVLWESNGVIFNITSEIESVELILMAESVKK